MGSDISAAGMSDNKLLCPVDYMKACYNATYNDNPIALFFILSIIEHSQFQIVLNNVLLIIYVP